MNESPTSLSAAADRLEALRRLTQIGVALSAERNIDRLLEAIIVQAREVTAADGGTLYILSPDGKDLHFAIVQTDSLEIRMGGTGTPIAWTPVAMYLPDGLENRSQVSAYAALTGDVVHIPDVYDAEGFNFQGTRDFDARTGYRSKSMLVVPMRDHEGAIIGVVQLINALDLATGQVVPFSAESRMMAESLASQAAVALSKNRLIQDLEKLLESFIRTIAMAIDEKSPYTGGHVQRVADLTMTIAGRINARTEGPYARVRFSDDEMKELRLAAWLHDVGKITTPEYVVDKATKLSTIFDRMELLRTRAEVMIRERQLALLTAACASGREPPEMEADDDVIRGIRDDIAFLETVNQGGEFLSDDALARLRKISRRQWFLAGEAKPLLSEEEMLNLSVRRGTLTASEREIINNHVRMTHRMLSELPFPRKMKNVADYAGGHHEKLDGSGYPFGWGEDRLSLQSRIMALADVFEALTAKDRPYKKGKTLSEALKILQGMVRERHLDADLFQLFVEDGIAEDYGRRELSTHQNDL